MAGFALSTACAAQAYPGKPVRLVVPLAAGGTGDTLARVVGEEMAKILGQPFVVENRPGSGGVIGTEAVARSAPDGYTLLSASPAHVIHPALRPNVGYDPVKDFEPITVVANTHQLIVGHPSVPAANVKEAMLKDFLHRKSRTGEVIRVTPERFYPRATLAQLAAIAQAVAQAAPGGQFTAAQFRDASGIGRGLAIEILECLDRLGITQRLGDARKMRKDFVPILGAATAPPAPAAAAPKPAAKPNPQAQRRAPLPDVKR